MYAFYVYVYYVRTYFINNESYLLGPAPLRDRKGLGSVRRLGGFGIVT